MLLVAVPVVVVGLRDAAPGVGFADDGGPAPGAAPTATPASPSPAPSPSPSPTVSPAPPPSPPPSPAPSASPEVAPPAAVTDVGATVLVSRYGRNGPEVPLAGGDADGSGCAPGPGPLPDGIWYGEVTAFDDASLAFNLICRYSGDRARAHPQYVAGDHVFVDESSLIRTVPVAPQAALSLLADRATPDSQTLVPVAGAPAFLAADPGLAAFPEAGVEGWVLVEGGLLRELLEPWYA
jgi:hypothetical protein